MRDSDRIRLGGSDELQIFHNGTHNFIDASGSTTDLYVRGANILLQDHANSNRNWLIGLADGSLRLHHAGNLKLETTTTGATITNDLVLNHASGDKAIRWATGGTNKWSLYHNNSAGALVAYDNANNAERLRIDSNGRISVNSNANASDANEGAQLRVTGTPITRNQYYSPAGDYYGSFGYTDNTYTKSWIAVDSSYNKASAVSAGIFLSAFHSDANGSACGHSIKNTRADGAGLIFSSVTTATSTGNPAVETEKMRISPSGVAINKNAAADAELEIVQSADPTIRLHDTRNAAYKVDFLMAGSGALIRNNNTTAADRTLVVQKGTTDHLIIEGSGAVRKPLSPAFSATLSSGNINAANYNNVIIFNNEQFDNGNNYDPSNGRFTASVAGKYYFGVQIYAGFDFTGVRVLHSKFVKNGSDFATADMFGGSSNHGGTSYHPTGCGHILMDLAVNDWVAFNSGGFSATGTGNALIYAQGGTRFFGYLVG